MRYFVLSIDMPEERRFIVQSDSLKEFKLHGLLLNNWVKDINEALSKDNLPGNTQFYTSVRKIAGCRINIAYHDKLTKEKLTEVENIIVAVNSGLVPLQDFEHKDLSD